jgi:ATP-binding cassette subfamily F protein uup
MALEAGPKTGKLIIEAKGISKSFGDNVILKPFDLRVMRGDRVAFVGPNGAGKTTILRLLTGEIAPDTGTLRHGSNLELAVFDQTRAQLDPDASLWDSLTQDPEMRVSGQSDQVMVRGQPRHVVGYLKDFLFDERQARAPVRSLSGGEKARLLLARIMARMSNVLVLDEPTNDLDVETLDLLQDLIQGFDGTVLLVSHDRDFLDRVAVTTIAVEGDGRAVVYAGGWSDYQSQRKAAGTAADRPGKDSKPDAAPKPAPKSSAPARAKPALSFTEKHRLEELPAEIERLEAEIGKLSELLSDADLFTREPAKFKKATEALAERQTKLSAAEDLWLELEEKAAGGG